MPTHVSHAKVKPWERDETIPILAFLERGFGVSGLQKKGGFAEAPEVVAFAGEFAGVVVMLVVLGTSMRVGLKGRRRSLRGAGHRVHAQPLEHGGGNVVHHAKR